MKISTKTSTKEFGGMWKFSSDVARHNVIAAAKALKAHSDVAYREMYVRAWGGNDQFAICFRAIGNQRQYIKTHSHLLRRIHGNNVMWDISSPLTEIL